MVERNAFADQQFQEYIDGRLSERDRAAVAAYLLAHPRVAAEVEAVRRQSEALRALGQEILDEPVPEELRRILRQHCARLRAGCEPGQTAVVVRRRQHLRTERRPAQAFAAPRAIRRWPAFVEVAAAVLVLCVGGAIGWLAHGFIRPAPSLQDLLLADMSRAYAFYGTRDYPVAFPPDHAEEFVSWIGRSFEREVRPPNLAEFGYSYRGGRMIPGGSANIGLFQFERPEGAMLAVFFWTAAAPSSFVQALNDRANLAARFWNTDGLSFAVVSDKSNRDLEAAAAAIFTFYHQSLGPG